MKITWFGLIVMVVFSFSIHMVNRSASNEWDRQEAETATPQLADRGRLTIEQPGESIEAVMQGGVMSGGAAENLTRQELADLIADQVMEAQLQTEDPSPKKLNNQDN